MHQVPGFEPKRRLGRGLSALLGGGGPASEEVAPGDVAELRHVAVQHLTRNPFQPRKEFDADALGELTGSIREHGILQPILVREMNGGYQVIAGERRWQAAVRAGLTSVPCRVVDVIDKTACEFALEENLKRRDLGDLEKAQAFRDYLSSFGGTVEDLARQLSMNRSTVSNFLRLLDLPEPVRLALASGKITAGHARSLLALQTAEQLELCGRIQAESMSVRQTEAAVRKALGRTAPSDAPQSAAAPESSLEPGSESESAQPVDAAPETIPLSDAAQDGQQQRTHHVASLEEQFRQLLGAKVEIRLTSKDAGTIMIPFSSNDEFERILRQVRRAAA